MKIEGKKISKMFFPAIFTLEENDAFTVVFPDLPGCITYGDNMEDAYEKAFDCLGIMLSYMEDNNEIIPKPSKPHEIKIIDNQVLVIVEFNMLEYKKRTNTKAVKKTLSIPEWMNEEAKKRNINFSNLLQEALLQKLQY